MPEVYSDFDVSFKRNPITGSLIRVVNDEAVKESLRAIVLTNRGEWAHHPSLGSKLSQLLFEPLDPVTAVDIVEVTKSALVKEPRANIISVTADPDYEHNGYRMEITFRTINSTRPVTFSELIKRVR